MRTIGRQCLGTSRSPLDRFVIPECMASDHYQWTGREALAYSGSTLLSVCSSTYPQSRAHGIPEMTAVFWIPRLCGLSRFRRTILQPQIMIRLDTVQLRSVGIVINGGVWFQARHYTRDYPEGVSCIRIRCVLRHAFKLNRVA